MSRKRLFSLINDLPTLFEVVTGRKPIKDKPSMDLGSKSKNGVKVSIIMRTHPFLPFQQLLYSPLVYVVFSLWHQWNYK